VGEGGGGANRTVDDVEKAGRCTRSCIRGEERRWCTSAQTEPLGLSFACWMRNEGRRRWRRVQWSGRLRKKACRYTRSRVRAKGGKVGCPGKPSCCSSILTLGWMITARTRVGVPKGEGDNVDSIICFYDRVTTHL